MTKKISVRYLLSIPVSKNFSEFRDKALDENNNDSPLVYDLSDKGTSEESVFSGLQADQVLFNLLMNLDDKGKIILLYQIIKEMGYGLSQEEFAKTLSMSRVWFSTETKKIRQKCIKIVQGASK